MPAEHIGEPAESVLTSFKQLHVAADYLNKVSDRLGTAISAIESKLTKLNLGIAAWVEFDSVEQFDKYLVSHQLGFEGNHFRIKKFEKRKTDKDWRLTGSDRFHCWPRDVRLKSVPSIPALIDLLRQKVEAKAMETKPIVEQADKFAEAIGVASSHSEESGNV